jgi:peptidoglycan pentaglycine glycine transferase (the first glycine)
VNKQAENFKEKYESFLQSNKKGHFMQSPQWAQLKSFWQNEIVCVEDTNGNIKGTISLLIRKIPFLPYTMMYSPRGPVCDPHDSATLQELLTKTKLLAKKYHSYVLKMDPDIEKADVEFEKIMKTLGYRLKGGLKPYEGIQPRFVFRLDVKGRSPEEVLQSFHQKTRYNIRLAIKKGVEIKAGARDDLGEFHRLLVDTGIRDKFIVRNRQYYEKVYDCLGPEHVRIFMAYYEGTLIAASIAIVYGNKCWYLYGASSNEYRNLMPNYLLQWEMIKLAIESGCDLYDFRGATGDLNEDSPLYGLYKFKKGFNGDFTEFVGMFDYVFNRPIYYLVENGITLVRELRLKMFVLKNKLTGKSRD